MLFRRYPDRAHRPILRFSDNFLSAVAPITLLDIPDSRTDSSQAFLTAFLR